jgi:hypothetical protein
MGRYYKRVKSYTRKNPSTCEEEKEEEIEEGEDEDDEYEIDLLDDVNADRIHIGW